jgi:hypothetical protein
LEEIDFHEIKVNIPIYEDLGYYSLGEIIKYFEKQGCKMVMKINDNMDIIIAFEYKN